MTDLLIMEWLRPKIHAVFRTAQKALITFTE